MKPVLLDGAAGEGGGQILRTALTLSMLTGRAFRMMNVRARRLKPGLMPQHLMAVRSAAEVCGAGVYGDERGSRELSFTPGPLKPGNYRFDIGTAGSTGLLAQTLIPALAMRRRPSRLILVGGTHVPMSPCYHYLAWQWQPYLHQIGLRVTVSMERAGFYPRGGGVLSVRIDPPSTLKPLQLNGRGRLLGITGLSAVANLPHHIVRRQRMQAEIRLARYPRIAIDEAHLEAYGQGTVLALLALFEHGSGCHFALGELGKPAEQVGEEAAGELLTYIDSGAAIDRYLADQLLLPLALVPGHSVFTGERVTTHLLTNAEVIRRFLPDVSLNIEQLEDGRAQVNLSGVALSLE